MQKDSGWVAILAVITKMAKAIITSAAVLAAFFLTSQSHASKCGDRAEMVKVLNDRYKEDRSAVGLSQSNTEFFEVFISEEGTWTVLMTLSTGQTCVVAAGHSWEAIKKVAGLKI